MHAKKWMLYMCMCGFERGGGTLGGLGDRDREKGDRDRLAGAWLAGWTSEAEREASTAVTAVAIEVAVVACCPTSEQAREDATEADEAGMRARRGGEAMEQRIGERERQRLECVR